ncbi:hypothetical protein D3C81_1828370 [compost metagenome]
MQRTGDLQFKALDELVLLEDRVDTRFQRAHVVIAPTFEREVVGVPGLTCDVSGQLVEAHFAGVDRGAFISRRLGLHRLDDRLR